MELKRLLKTTLLSALLFSCRPEAFIVYPAFETDPVASPDDAADDAAIFIHPGDASRNAIIGTDKQKGLIVYDAQGRAVHRYPFGRINNVDLRQEVDWNGRRITIVGGSNRSDNSLVFYRLDEEGLALAPLHEQPFFSKVNEVYGFCLYRNTQLYAFVVGKDGIVEQWELHPDPAGRMEAEMVRTFDVGGQCEGLAADDELGHLYVGEEMVGIWKYGAGPEEGAVRTQVLAVRENKNLKADIEGLAIYYGENGEGYLLASSQGNNTYAVFERQGNNRYLGSFRIKGKDGLGGTSETDGIDVTARAFGPRFPRGIFVAQDGKNGRSPQNFKIVDWADIERVLAASISNRN